MTTLLLAIIGALLVVLLTFLWQHQQQDAPPEVDEDHRISPLLRGINYLLSDAPDKALQEMVQVARLRTEAIDVYMALGEMFRAQGEIGRAVRIHQNILARPDVSEAYQLDAYMALAKDFQTGGLLDRAIRFYDKALYLRPNHPDALEAILRIREQSGEWEEATAVLFQLEHVRDEEQSLHRAYLHAEIAKKAFDTKEYDVAAENAVTSLELDASCAHAYLIQIRLFLMHGSYDDANACLATMWERAPEHVALVLVFLMEHAPFISGEYADDMVKVWQQRGDERTALAWIEIMYHKHGEQASHELQETLRFSPQSLQACLRLAAIHGADTDRLTQYARAWRKRMKQYVCAECGVEVVDLRWQCPQCHAWGSMHMMKDEG